MGIENYPTDSLEYHVEAYGYWEPEKTVEISNMIREVAKEQTVCGWPITEIEYLDMFVGVIKSFHGEFCKLTAKKAVEEIMKRLEEGDGDAGQTNS